MKKNPIKVNSPPALTLQQLISKKMKEKEISRSQLVHSIGYTNTTKGIRRFNDYLNTLYAPSDEFKSKLLSALGIDGLSYCKALAASMDEMNAKAKNEFKPFVRLLINFSPSPCFAAQYVYGKCHLPIPEQILNFPFPEEIRSITHLYQEYAATLPFHDRIIGFQYHREYEYFFEYDADLILKEVQFTRLKHEKKLFGNRVFDMIIGQ